MRWETEAGLGKRKMLEIGTGWSGQDRGKMEGGVSCGPEEERVEECRGSRETRQK